MTTIRSRRASCDGGRSTAVRWAAVAFSILAGFTALIGIIAFHVLYIRVDDRPATILTSYEHSPIDHQWMLLRMKNIAYVKFVSIREATGPHSAEEAAVLQTPHPATIIPNWGRIDETGDALGSRNNDCQVTEGYGWPCIALWCDFDYQYYDSSTYPNWAVVGAIGQVQIPDVFKKYGWAGSYGWPTPVIIPYITPATVILTVDVHAA